MSGDSEGAPTNREVMLRGFTGEELAYMMRSSGMPEAWLDEPCEYPEREA